jgi:hypothetical protein
MPILESIALAIAPILAKAVVKSFIEDGLINDISGAFVDLLTDKGQQSLSQRHQVKPLATMTQDMADRMRIIFRNASISKESKTVVVEEFALTLARVSITSEKLIQFNLEPKPFEHYLRNSRPEATSRLSQTETDYYGRLLHEASKAMMAIALEVDDFERQFARQVLINQDDILEKVMMLLQHPENEAKQFEERYCGVVKRELDRLETFGLRQIDSATSRQSLSIAYITLQGSAQSEFGHFEQEMNGKDFYRHRVEVSRTMKSSAPIDMILARSRRIVVRGEAGSGKSTLLQWIAVRSSERDFPDNLVGLNNTVPFFIRLREHVKTGFPSTEEFPAQVARMLTGEMPASWVHDQLDSGRAIVLVDGVDELPQGRRTEMLNSLRQLVTAYPYARYLVTSRPTAIKAEEWPEWQAWVKEEGFFETTLQPMSIPQIEEFIDHWYSALIRSITDEKERREIRDYPRDLKQLLRQRVPLRRLATTPILCAMICALYRERQQSLPSERIELYQGCVEMLLTRRDEGRKIRRGEDYPNLSYSQMLALIQNFAYWLLQNDYSDVELAEADERFKQWLKNMNFEATGEAVRRLFVDRSGLLREPVVGRLDFTHRTFQEYLAAQAAIKEGDIGVLISNARNDLWRETIILAVGEARPKEREKLLTGLLKKGDRLIRKENRYQVYMLAIASLETAVELSPEIRDQVLEKAREIIPPRDADEVKLIAAAGEPIAPLLSWNETYARSRKARCIEALALIGSKKALHVLADYRQDEQVQRALSRAWNKFDVVQFAAIFFENTTSLVLDDLTAIALLGNPPKSLPNLTQLTLWSDQLSDIGVLGQLPNLTQLTLRSDQLSDIGVLGQLPNLTQLELSSDQLSDIGVLGQLPNLTQLTLWSDQLSDIGVLGQLPNLTQLELSSDQLSDTRALRSIPPSVEIFLH